MSKRFPFFLLLGAIGCVAMGCDNDTPATAPAPSPTTSFDAGPGGQDQAEADGGTKEAGAIPPTPGPGPSTLGLTLPEFYAFVMAPNAIASSGMSFLGISTGPGAPVTDLDRAVFKLELNASAQGRKPGAIPVFVRAATRPSPNVGFQADNDLVCAESRNGSSGRMYLTLQKVASDPMTGAPSPQSVDGCSWFLVIVEVSGKKRYKPMIFWKGEEVYLAGTASDAATGRRVHFGETFSRGPSFQLLSGDHIGPIPE